MSGEPADDVLRCPKCGEPLVLIATQGPDYWECMECGGVYSDTDHGV